MPLSYVEYLICHIISVSLAKCVTTSSDYRVTFQFYVIESQLFLCQPPAFVHSSQRCFSVSVYIQHSVKLLPTCM